MTSGIYKLTFSNSRFYIGKSVDVHKRWSQHYDKFIKGTAAKNMQDAYNSCGYPRTEILCECHPDHLDILEPLYIQEAIKQYNCLNTSIPEIYDYGDMDYLSTSSLIKQSTLSHIQLIDSLRAELASLKSEEGIFEILYEIEELKEEIIDANDRTKRAVEALFKERNKGFWERLFG